MIDPLAAVCATLSRRAYDAHPDFASLGFKPLARFDRWGTQAWLITDGARAILVFRGTEPDDPRDLIADVRYVKTDFPGGGRVHLGFWLAFQRVSEAIGASLPPRPLIITGHSLGAALSLLGAATWPTEAVYLYGCPRVGNRAFIDRIVCPVHRFENRADLVTHIPPPTSLIQAGYALAHLRLPTLYRHPGEPIRLSGLGHRSAAYEDAARAHGGIAA